MASKKKTQTGKGKNRTKGGKNTQPPRNVGIEMLGLGIVCIALVSFVVLLSTDDPSNAVRSLLEGLSGYFSYVLPFIILWVGILFAFSGTRKYNPGRILMIASCILLVFSLVHIFYAEQILCGLRLGSGWLNFIEQSFFMRAGTGAIGALLSYPAYMFVGKWGGFVILLFLLLGNIILLKQISLRQVGEKAHDYFQSSYNEFRQYQSDRAIERAQRRQEAEEERIARRQNWASWDEPVFEENVAEPIEPITPPSQAVPPLPRRGEMLEVPEYLKEGKRKEKRIFGEKPKEQTPVSSPFHTKSSRLVAETAPADSEQESLFDEESAASAAIDQTTSPFDPVSTEDAAEFAAMWEDTAEPYVSEPEDETPVVSEEDEETETHYDISDTMTFDNTTGNELASDEEIPETSSSFEPLEFPPLDLAEPILRERRRKVLGEPVRPLASSASAENHDEPSESFESDSSASAMRLDHTPLVIPKRPDPEIEEVGCEYNYPPVDLLALPKPTMETNQEGDDREKAIKLEETLKSFGINAKLTGIAHGPAVTRFELAPAPGVKVSRITSLADDIALNLAALSVRIEAPIPGKAAVGVEIPNENVETVPLREVLESTEARKHPSRLAVAMGKDNGGRYIVGDIAKMPHVLIAGATGSGKSVCINCIICSILYRATPDEVRLIMIDPKVVELSIYNGIPHLLVPVVTDPKKAAGALHWAVVEMTERYKKFAERGVRDMKGYNLSCGPEDKPMPQIVIIIDELADLMMVAPGEVEDSICRLAQLARAAGIHLVIATQRPSVNVITGVIKANIPARIAFTVASFVDSRTILDVGGAEKLLGRGDMLFAPSGSNKMQRVQGAWVSDEEVHSIVEYIKERHDVEYDEDVIEHMNKAEDTVEADAEEASDECDELLQQAIEIAVEAGQASISMLQRRLRIGYARAGRLIDEMAARGIIGQSEGAKPRNLLITREQYNAMFKDHNPVE